MIDRPTDSAGGLGGISGRLRSHLRPLEDAVYGGWELPPDVSAAIPTMLREIMDDPTATARDRIRASECLAALRRDRVDAVIQLDRINRLDAGTATDRIEVLASLTDAQLGAVALAVSNPVNQCEEPKPKPKRKP